MLDEVLTAEERAVVARAKAFAEEHVAPNAARWEWERRYPLETIKAACAAGLNTIELAKQHGGQGLSFSCKLRAFEEIARHDFAFAFALINHHNACARFARDGKPAHVARLLPRMIAGEVIGCAGLSEPGVGSDFGGLEMAAVRVDGGWKLNGAKAWITNAAVAGLSVAYAQTDKSQGYRGIACFAIEADRPGFQRDKPFELHGGHAIGVGGFHLVDYFAPDEAVLHEPGKAFKAALAGINGARAYVAAMCCGMLQASLETAVRYTQQRKTFGQPVLDHQGVRWKLVDAATDLEAARLLTYRAARLIDEGGDAVLPAAYAKKFATDMAVNRIADCIQAMGANGLRAEYPLARHLAGAKIAAYTDGSIEMMNERIGAGLPAVFRNARRSQALSARLSAWSRSSNRSPLSSTPTDRRRRSGGQGVPGAFDAGAMLDQAFDAAQRGRALPQRHARGRGDRRALAALDAHRQHAAEAARHLLPRDRVAGERRQAGIEHLAHHRVGGEALGQRLRRAAGPVDAREQRAHAAHQQPRLGLAEDACRAGRGSCAASPSGHRRARRPGRRQ